MNSKEALKLLETRCRFFAQDKDELQETYEARETIKKDLEILEIIKTKNVDISLIKNCYGPLACAVYNSYIDNEKKDKLTKEEFDLLKEWLGNVKN